MMLMASINASTGCDFLIRVSSRGTEPHTARIRYL